MSLPVTVPFTFGNATTTQSLSSLDTNFTTITNSVNGLTNGASQINVASISATGTANATTFLRGDGSWTVVSGSGTVTSINANSTIGFTFTGGPVTSSGTLTLSGPTPGTSGNVLTSNGTVWLSSAGAYPLTSGTNQPTTSGTSVTFTGIPSWAKRITVIIAGVSTAATSNYLIQLVTGGGTVSSGYNSGANGGTSGVATATATNGFLVSGSINANDIQGGVVTICNVTSNIWCYSTVLNTANSTGRFQSGGGNVNAGATVTGLIFTTVAGSTFTAGNVNILYE